GAHVEVHDDYFDIDTDDVNWLPVVAANGWLILTKDANIKRNALERTALQRSGGRMFVLVSGNLTGQEAAEIFVSALQAMRDFAAKRAGGFIAKVLRDGSVLEWSP